MKEETNNPARNETIGSVANVGISEDKCPDGKFRCIECNKVFDKSEQSCSDLEVCEGCYEEKYETCATCGKHVRKGCLTDGTCYTCIVNHGSICIGPYHVGSYNGAVYHKTGEDIDETDPIYMGIELEYGNATLKNASKCALRITGAFSRFDEVFWLERDSSIPRFGFELITQPYTLSAFRGNLIASGLLAEIMAEIKKHGLKACDGCGMHVHCGVEGGNMDKLLGEKGRIALDCLFAKRKRFFELLSGRSTKYAQFKSENSEDLGKNPKNNRHNAINFCDRNGTIEFRTFASTTDLSAMEARLGLCESLIRYCRRFDNKEGGSPNLMEWIKTLGGNTEYYKKTGEYILEKIQ